MSHDSGHTNCALCHLNRSHCWLHKGGGGAGTERVPASHLDTALRLQDCRHCTRSGWRRWLVVVLPLRPPPAGAARQDPPSPLDIIFS